MEEQKITRKRKENFNPLKKEVVEVRYLPLMSKMYDNPESPLHHGLAETSSIVYAVPRENGMIKAVLNEDEQAFFERELGLSEGAMNPNLISNNYWTTYNRGYINRVSLDKTTKRLYLDRIKDYIEYKILCANTEYICPNQEALENNRKATYRFVMTNDTTAAENAGKNADLKLELFEVYSKYKNDADMLRIILYLIEHKKPSPNTKIELLKEKIVNMIETRAKECYAVMSSKTLEQKKAVLVGVEKGIISERNGFYYLVDNGQKLSEDYEEPNLNNAANYLADVKNQELYFSISKKSK